MEQIKIGRFIAERRKTKNLTQLQLAEKLNITDRAISKWETGKGMPDSSIMMELCKELDISVNELLSGELIDMNNYNTKLDENLIRLQKQKEYGITSARWSHVITIIILFIWNIINVFKYGVEEAISKPEFIYHDQVINALLKCIYYEEWEYYDTLCTHVKYTKQFSKVSYTWFKITFGEDMANYIANSCYLYPTKSRNKIYLFKNNKITKIDLPEKEQKNPKTRTKTK